MSIFTFLSLLTAVVAVFLGNYIYYKNPHNRINRTYFSYAIIGAFTAFCEFMTRNAATHGEAMMWGKLSAVWPLFPSILLHMILIYRNEQHLIRSRWIYLIIYGPAVVFILLNVSTDLLIRMLVHASWGWTHVAASTHPAYLSVLIAWNIAMGVVTCWLGIQYYRSLPVSTVKNQTRFILIGIALPVFCGLITEGLLPGLGIRTPGMSTTAFMVGSIFIGYAIRKHRLFLLAPATVTRDIFTIMADSLIITNDSGTIVMVNRSAQHLLGYQEKELVGHPIGSIFNEEQHLKGMNSGDLTPNFAAVREIETTAKTKADQRVPVALMISRIQDPFSNEPGMLYVFRDLTERNRIRKALQEARDELKQRVKDRTAELRKEIEGRKQVEIAMRHSEQDYRTLFENANDALIVFVPEKEIVLDVNQHACELYGYDRSEFIGMSLEKISTNIAKGREQIHLTLDNDAHHTFETRQKRKDGSELYVHIKASTINFRGQQAILSINSDITKRIEMETSLRRINETLQTSLREKEVLLKEIHHRVKNNMQIISSLLNLQAQEIADVKTLRKFKESEYRIRSMSLIHEKLYQTEDLSRINFAEYIPDLACYLFSSYPQHSDKLKLALDVEEISLGIDKAIPCGLIVNELITNALKYAFPDDRSGEITIRFHKELQEAPSYVKSREVKYLLVIGDNGVGFPDHINPQQLNSLGLKLVQSLVQQLKGKLRIQAKKGMEFLIEFSNAESGMSPSLKEAGI